MKKLLLAFAVCTCFTGYAQEGVEQEYSIMVADVDIMQIDGLEYIEIVGQQNF